MATLVASPTGDELAIARESPEEKRATVALWNPGTGQEVELFASADDETAYALAYSPDGRTLAVGCFSGVLRLVELRAGHARSTREVSGMGQITALAFAPNGRTIAVGDWSGMVTLWDAESLQRIDAFQAIGTRPRYLPWWLILLAIAAWALAWRRTR